MARGPRISDQLREHIVSWREEGTSIQEIARLAGCKERAIYKILALHRATGGIATPESLIPRGRPRVLSRTDIEYILSLLADNPTIYLDEIQAKLAANREVDVSLASISRTLRRLALSHKSVAKEAAERDELLRATWIATHGNIPMDHFVWLDESSVDDITNQRQKGWSPIVQACVHRATFIRGQRYSVLPISIKPPFELRRAEANGSEHGSEAISQEPLRKPSRFRRFSGCPASWLHNGGSYELVAALLGP